MIHSKTPTMRFGSSDFFLGGPWWWSAFGILGCHEQVAISFQTFSKKGPGSRVLHPKCQCLGAKKNSLNKPLVPGGHFFFLVGGSRLEMGKSSSSPGSCRFCWKVFRNFRDSQLGAGGIFGSFFFLKCEIF